MTARVLIFGAGGQLGRALARRLPHARALTRAEADLADPVACARIVRMSGADLVINAAAFTDVDGAEASPDLAYTVNAQAPAAIAGAAAGAGIPLVHVSTDFVFDGSGTRPWKPGDRPRPLGIYGLSKRAGEQAILLSGARAVTIRTSWVFSGEGGDFPSAILRAARMRTELAVVDDQIGGPTHADDLADACIRAGEALVAGRSLPALLHFAGQPDVSRADFARTILDMAGSATIIRPVATHEMPRPARRPLNSRLDCRDAERALGLDRPDWRTALKATLARVDGEEAA
ncbi:MAG: dTDP-4-dehydrorhamnose reductase [Rubricella sp.]